jgi:hypothetical protein
MKDNLKVLSGRIGANLENYPDAGGIPVVPSDVL